MGMSNKTKLIDGTLTGLLREEYLGIQKLIEEINQKRDAKGNSIKYVYLRKKGSSMSTQRIPVSEIEDNLTKRGLISEDIEWEQANMTFARALYPHLYK